MIYLSKERPDGPAENSTCRGFDFAIAVGGVTFKVRSYNDKPAEFTVISPEPARKLPQVRQLVDYLVSVLGGQRMFFYDESNEAYREADLQTLEFKTDENNAGWGGSKIKTHQIHNSSFESVRLFPA